MTRHKTPLKEWFGVFPVGWCIYSLVHDETGREYIGMTKDLNRRLAAHCGYIDSNEPVYSDVFLLDGINHIFSLRPRILEFCANREEALAAEDRLIKQRKPAYNKGEDRAGNYASRTRTISESAYEACKKNLAEYMQGTPVVCITDGREFPGVTAAAKYYRVSATMIVDNCKHRNISSKGLVFEYLEEAKRVGLPERVIPKSKKIKVLCITTGKTHQSITEAANVYGISAGNICEQLNGKKTHVRGLIFAKVV